MADEETPAVETVTEEPAPPPPAVIHSAQYDYDGSTVMLSITKEGDTAPIQYALNATDPYGLSPWLRDELKRMVDASEITIEPAPTAPVDE